jgi:molecular chaperone DnaK
MAKYFGIDFGTTNSAVVVYDDQRKRFTRIGEKGPIPFPSIVAVDNLTQEVWAGQKVKDRLIELREGRLHVVVESVKSMLDADQLWTTPRKTWRAEAIASELFRALAKRSEEEGHDLCEAVIAIPVGMNSAKRASLRRAAQKAGIEVLGLISEPTAAFMANSKELQHCRYAVVFDWGGGTLDVSVLEVNDHCVTERFTDGSPKAGDHIDRLLAQWLHGRICEANDLSIEFDAVAPVERYILLNEAEKAKRYLQQEGATEARVELGRYAGLNLISQTLSKSTFNDLVKDVVSSALDLLMQSVGRSRISLEEVGKLIVVGGTSQLTLLQEELIRRWPHANILFPPEADWDIARGAAWLSVYPGCYRLAESIGVVLADDEFHAIFPSRTNQDAHSSLHFGLVEDANAATFNFAAQNGGQSPRHIGELHAPCFGFRDELIQLESRVTSDLIFVADAASDALADDTRSFEYDLLRWMYELPPENQ